VSHGAPSVDIGVFASWLHKADQNVEKWGLQDEETLLLAMQEELGELTQAHLEARAEDGDPDRVDEEMDDLGALLLQLHMARDGVEVSELVQ
jgi:NTP pyrophosphatase (non-canonical NTP hydrolase)